MTDTPGANETPDRPSPGEVPSEWAAPNASSPPLLPPPPVSSLAPPPPPVSSLAPPPPPVAVVSTGPIEAEPVGQRGWFGRGIALTAAALLVGGGGYLAINAGATDGGADTPRDALDGALAALSAEDFIGAAEFVEPAERDTMIDAGFEVVNELIRLEVFDDSLDMSSVEGIDLEFEDVEIRAIEVAPGLAHLFIEGGTVRTELESASVPYGALVTDRIAADTLDISEQHTEQLTRSESPIVAVERDGRWYLSMWYSIAENARLALGQPLPDAADRLVAIGADSPEGAVDEFVRAVERVDLSSMIGMLDPEEAAVLYDYGSFFVDDAQDAVDELLRMVDDEGWSWEITELVSRANVDGDLATVYVDRFAVTAGSDEVRFDISFSPEQVSVAMESDEVTFDYVVEGECMTVTVDEGRGPETEEMCTGELLGIFGLDGFGASGSDNPTEEMGIVVRNVDGRWFVSPIRTGSTMMLQALRAVDADDLAEMVDDLSEFAADPFGFGPEIADGGDFFGEDFFGEDGEDFFGEDGEDFFGESDDPFVSTTTFPFENEYPPLTDENASMIVAELDVLSATDLEGAYRDDMWFVHLPDIEPLEFGEGVEAHAFLPGGDYLEIVVLQDLVFATDADLAAWLEGDVITDEGFTYVHRVNGWDEDVIAARSSDGIAFITSSSGIRPEALGALRTQVGG